MTLVTLLGMAAVPAAAPPGDNPGSSAPGRSSSPYRDADRDKVYDDLETQLSRRADGERVTAIVLFDHKVTDEDLARDRRDVGDFPVKARWTTVEGYSAELTKGQVNALSRRPDVVQIEAETRVQASMSTARSSYGVDKAVSDFAVDGDGNGSPRSYGPSDVGVCVLDTGIDAGHVDLDGGQVVAWRDYVNARPAPYDDNGHGTHVAGIVAGQGDGDAAYRGVAPGSALVGLKVLDSTGSGTSTNIISAIDFCVANRSAYNVRVVNLSLGSSGPSDGTDSMSVAVTRAFDNGVLPVVAAGNAGPATSTVGSPGAAARGVTVCSLADTGENGFFLSSFSSRGATADGRTKPDVCGPGHRITAPAANSGNGYVIYSGTSMATPFAAGVAALMLDADPTETPTSLRDQLVATAEDRLLPGPDVDTGNGRLQAYDAVRSAGGRTGTGPDHPDRHLTGSHGLATTGASESWSFDVTGTAFPVAVTLIVPGASASRDFELNLYDPSGARVAQSQGPDRQETVAVVPRATGRYRAEVRSVAGAGDYHLDFSHRGPAPVKETVPDRAPSVGPGTYEDGSPAVTYTGSWVSTSNVNDSGGSTRYSNAAGAAAELRFSGTGVRWLARRQSNAGVADVLIDGAKVASVDLYSPTLRYRQVVYEKPDLAPGPHTISVVRTGTKNSSSASALALLDAFVVLPDPVGAGTYQENNAAIAYTGAWYSSSSTGDSGGSVKYTTAAGAASELRFSGTGIRWLARRQSNAGISDVFLDGVKVGSVDLYNPTTRRQQVVFERTGLSPGTHVIRIVRTGTKNPSSTGTTQLLDAYVVVG
ncbi:MAG TPA: S8 family serine peptidase [Acidimicrobiales bacterium]|nr:S8 family serine peptidase [Acidimicrobiales bacterium]